ncbi:MAG TPA: HD domain-containing protein [Hyphomicrobiales bacterium]|nr:HD domain-containing protein [Kaistiaceae bacterium]HQF30489.1 HD domain-containing protein [Hyphomicrobiales bacterium]
MSEDVLFVIRAMRFATEAHTDQRRKGERAEPYVNHLVEVADLVAGASQGRDRNLIAAALLHDVVEDTTHSIDEITAAFGEDVAMLVAAVTDDKSLSKGERKELQVLKAPHLTPRAKMLKLADKTSNLRSIMESPPAGWDFHRRQAYFNWARAVVEGCRGVSPELEAAFDAAFEAGTGNGYGISDPLAAIEG